MIYNIVYKKSVHRDLKKIPKLEARCILDQIESEMPKGACSNPVLKGQFVGLRRFRIGDWRVIYAIIGDDVLVLRICHRKDAYRKKI